MKGIINGHLAQVANASVLVTSDDIQTVGFHCQVLLISVHDGENSSWSFCGYPDLNQSTYNKFSPKILGTLETLQKLS